ncbi:50S ribosomal protein L6 [Candidatus Woesearchaeota archaeon]|nr:50S ribosomal protein L6 [Candidatus Woesearchaeota archaeon]
MPDKKSKEVGNKLKTKEIEFDKGITASYDNGILSVKGKKGSVEKRLLSKNVKIAVKDGKVVMNASKSTKREKKILASFEAHIKNMINGALDGYRYVLKICSGHFPMNVSVSNKELIIKNFLGEKVPRKLRIKEGANVKVEGELVVVESANKETAGQVSADIENLTRRPGYDTRVFQDGIYIISKGNEAK